MTMLELEGVARRFQGGAGVTGLDLRLAPGEIVALVGLNGAGKTTLLRLALGMLRPDHGAVKIDGVPIGRLAADAWRQVGHLIEVPFSYRELTVRQNLEMSANLRGAPLSIVDRALPAWRLDALADRRAGRLSLGNRQRVGLAAALQHAPRLVLLDEPANALDPAGVLILRDALVARAAAGAAVLVSSHHLDEVARIADRVIVMNRGRLIGELDATGHDLERTFFDRIHADDLEESSA
ncbi:hypothetical protein GCM10022200_16600 [Microbacterium awajiense]|uniref:ABC transporter domain-containing protein n=1 Tax=Microbacterium awajiense TaxID=415214 RepID=A0ABP7AK02_9MICO